MKKISTLLLCIVLAAALALAATAVGCKSSGTDKPNENQGDNDMNNDIGTADQNRTVRY